MPGMVKVGGSYEKGSSEQSSKTVTYEGFKWLVSPENCVAEGKKHHSSFLNDF